MKSLRTICSCCLVLALSACASLSEEECLYADWRLIGTEDGSFGRPITTLAEHRKACAKYGVTPNQSQYEAGHYQGLLRYCTYQNGFQLGQAGGALPTFCPAEKAGSFSSGYMKGKLVFESAQAIRNTQQLINELLDNIHFTEDEIARHEALLVSGEGNDQIRRDSLQALDELKSQRHFQEEELIRLESRLDHQQQDHQQLLN